VIVVVGGTGRLGRVVVRQLLDLGEAVRVVARHAPTGDVSPAEFVVADVRRPETLPAALAGAVVVVSAMHGFDPAAGQSPATVDRDGNRSLIAAARREGAETVLVSLLDARPDHPAELFRMKSAAEQALRDGPDDWTIVRASAFAEAWGDIVRGTRNGKGVPKVFGRGENPINFVAVDDVATAVTRAVTDRSLRGQVIEVGGPDNLTMTQFAQLVTGQSDVTHIPRTVLRLASLVLGLVKPAQARLIRTALVQDSADLRFDPAASTAAHPWLPCTSVRTVLADRPA
jgi:NADH dehydrogenase